MLVKYIQAYCTHLGLFEPGKTKVKKFQ